MQFPPLLEDRIQIETERGLARKLRLPSGTDFTSNDYLGFAQDRELAENFQRRLSAYPLSAAGSRLLRGHLALFDELENTLSAFSGQPAALFFPSGYQANVGLFSSLLRPGDTVYSDALNHASIVDGIKLGRAAKVIYPHGDLAALTESLKYAPTSSGLRVIVTESLFSMDGDIADLAELVSIADRYNALLIVDEAHATGLGDAGIVKQLGLNDRVFATVHTAGKALGTTGAWIAGGSRLRDYLIQFSRAFIYSTAPAPAQALALLASIEHWKKHGVKRAHELEGRFAEFHRRLRTSLPESVRIPLVKGPILPVILGNTTHALAVARALQDDGLDVRAIRPPTVPVGQDRLRITLHWSNTETDLEKLLVSLTQHLGRVHS